jgi:hypothetical protein
MSIKAASVRVIVAALLLGAGWVCWTAGLLQARLVDAQSRMITLQYEGSLSEYDDIEQSLGYLDQFPARVTRTLADMSERRATALYWDKRYGTLSLARDASGELIETNPAILFLAANAAYRAGNHAGGERVANIRALDTAIANYAEVLKKAPGHVDAAYNYEYAVRARAAATSSRETPRAKGGQRAAQPSVAGEGTVGPHDLPAGPTIHGNPGAPPPDGENSKFKMLVPMQPDERQGTPDRAGEGARPVRRG